MKKLFVILTLLYSTVSIAQLPTLKHSIQVGYGITGGDGFAEIPDWAIHYNYNLTDKFMVSLAYNNASLSRNTQNPEGINVLRENELLLSSHDASDIKSSFYQYRSIGLQAAYRINGSTRSSLYFKTGLRYISRHSNEANISESLINFVNTNRNSSKSIGIEIALDYRYRINDYLELGGQAYHMFIAFQFGGNVFLALKF